MTFSKPVGSFYLPVEPWRLFPHRVVLCCSTRLYPVGCDGGYDELCHAVAFVCTVVEMAVVNEVDHDLARIFGIDHTGHVPE